MDLDQYLEKMITNTIVIWILPTVYTADLTFIALHRSFHSLHTAQALLRYGPAYAGLRPCYGPGLATLRPKGLY